MARSAHELMTIEGELHGPVASAQLVHFDFPAPIDNVMQDNDAYRVDLCLTPRPRNARACYPQRWGAQRFERIGDVFMVPPGEALLAVSDGRCRQTSIVCKINPPAMQDWFEGGLEWTERSLSAGLDIRERNIHTLLLRLADEARHPGFASEMLVELIAAQLAIELARYCNASNAPEADRGLSQWRLRKIDERLQDVSAPPTLGELAALCQMSVRQLTRGFRRNRGCSIGDYVAEYRVAQARQLLATDQSIKAIAYALGFASPSSFCYAFRRATAETPSQFRQRLVQFH